MEPTRADLQQIYSKMKSKELIKLAANGGLTELAQEVMREELTGRNLEYPATRKESWIDNDYKAIITILLGGLLMFVGLYIFEMPPDVGLIIGAATGVLGLKFVIGSKPA